MLKLCLAQLKKLFYRTDVKWILTILALLPFGIAMLISMESGIVQIGESVFTVMGYGSVVVGLLNSLLLISVTVALVATALISKEIDTGLDSMYVTKVRSRGQIILSKMIALDLLIVSMFVLMLLSSIIGWFVFLKNSPFGTDVFWSVQEDRDEIFTLIYTVVGPFFETLVMVRVYTLFSLLFKYGKAIIFNFVTVVLFKLLANIEQIRLWIPSYIGGGTHLMEYTGDTLLHNGLYSLALLAGYAVVLTIVNHFLYKRIDLSR